MPPQPTTAKVSPSRRSAEFLSAPKAVKSAHPRMADSSNGTLSGSKVAPEAGVTQYSACAPTRAKGLHTSAQGERHTAGEVHGSGYRNHLQ